MTDDTPRYRYDFQAIERKWQDQWQTCRTFRTAGPGEPDFDPDKPRFYVLDMFPYPSGVGLHVGHPLGYIATDIVARFKRMTGYNVLHPMGFDAFGLPAEQYAVEHGVHPRITTEQNIANMLRQLKALGLSYDWDRCLATTDVGYYKWTQWIFLQMYNSYFDPVDQRARPIDELVVKLENAVYFVSMDGGIVPAIDQGLAGLEGEPIGVRKWHELDDDQRAAFLDEHRLAYLAEVPVNWCPALGTVLANEEVTNEGRSERGNHPVYKRPLKQWMLRITAYAQRLADDLDEVNWPEAIKKMQRDWIGRSEGAMVDFPLADSDEMIRVFTTRPDTLFGATYMVLAPEHPLVEQVVTDAQRGAVRDYQRRAESRSDVDRMAEAKEKTGVFTGGYAINPVNDKKIPIWIADYVLMGYGTGAIMAVPAHDERDFEFATTFDLPIVEVVRPSGASDDASVASQADAPTASTLAAAFTAPGVNVRSANAEVSLDGLPTRQAKKVITEWLDQKGLGKAQVQYKLRDWLFSRQRYWGEPFPILHDDQTGRTIALSENELPVVLPEMVDFTPVATDDPQAPPQPPLGRAPENWRFVQRDGRTLRRELNTMPQWAGSCWYYLRYLDSTNERRFVDSHKERYWMAPTAHNPAGGVDLYVGGAEHAVLHLLYARFWHKVLYDLGHVSTSEPFGRLFNQGYIQAYAYTDERGVYVPADQVVNADNKPAAEVQGNPGERFFYNGQPVTEVYGKMGKSLKNAVSPDEIGARYGCDTLRLYEMYMGPLDASKPWNTRDIIGVHRFLQRLWRNFVNEDTGESLVTDACAEEPLLRLLHKTIYRVTADMERMTFNTAIAALIELNNALVGRTTLPRAVAEPMVLMLAPLAPHLAEELWQRLGHETTVAYADWPAYDPMYLVEDQVELAVQIMGKVRGRITVAADADQTTVREAAMADARIAALLEGKTVRKVIVVPGKLVNIVAN